MDGFRFRSQLPDALERFEIELFFNRLPMFIILILIVLVVLYYVITLGSMLVEAQKPEIALLRSRGATSFQILAVFMVEAALLSAGAFVVGPLVALVTVSVIGIVPGLGELNGGDPLPVRLTADVYKLAGLGAVIDVAGAHGTGDPRLPAWHVEGTPVAGPPRPSGGSTTLLPGRGLPGNRHISVLAVDQAGLVRGHEALSAKRRSTN